MKLSQSYFNPRAPYGARRAAGNHRELAGDISIHAPHTGRDKRGLLSQVEATEFQSTRPIRGATSAHSWQRYSAHLFQSTRPIRGATNQFLHAGLEIAISIHAPHTGRDAEVGARHISRRYFNPRAPYGARRWVRNQHKTEGRISIHAPHTGRDMAQDGIRREYMPISIHAPHTGRDLHGGVGPGQRMDFNPRAPYGARRIQMRILRKNSLDFNPRAPYGARQGDLFWASFQRNFNPRAPYGARLSAISYFHQVEKNFNPRAPYGARLARLIFCDCWRCISIHAPHTGRDYLRH